MTMNWYELSQVNIGLVMNNTKNPLAYTPDNFAPPFDEVLRYIKNHAEWSIEDLYTNFAPSELDGALHSVTSLNGSSKSIDWASNLRKAQEIYEISEDLERTGRAGKKGLLPDLLPLQSKIRAYAQGQTAGLRPSTDVDWQSATGLIPSGWDAIDKTIGGIAESGPVVICAPTKTGKSFFTSKLLECFLNYYTDKRAAVYPLELTDKRYLKRAFEMYPELVKPHKEGRIFISSRIRTVSEIAASAEAVENCGMIIIDGIDGLVKGDYDTSKFAGTWSQIIELGVMLDIPIVVTTQPNRQGKWTSMTKFLDMYAIEWSGAAENGAEQLWMLQYIPHSIDFTDERFPVYDNAYYIISWLQREGWTKAQNGPGAIIFKDHIYDKSGNIRLWDGPAYGDKSGVPTLWRPGAATPVKKYSSRRAKPDDNE